MNRKYYTGRLVCAALSAALCLSLCSCSLIEIKNDEESSAAQTSAAPVPEVTADITVELTSASDETTAVTSSLKPVASKDNFGIAQKYLSALVTRDLSGVPITIAAVDSSLYAPSAADTLVSSARIERNSMVEEKYNTTIISNRASLQDIYDQSVACVLSGDFYADLISIPMSALGSFAAKGLLASMNSLPFTDYSAPYYNGAAMSQMNAGNKLYAALGELNTDIEKLWCVYFNKTIVEKLGITSPYELVYKNKWTWDSFSSMTKAVSSLDGIYGHASGADVDLYTDVLFSSAGDNYFICGEGKLPVQKAVKKSVLELISDIKNVIYDNGTVYDGGTLSGNYSPDGALRAFYGGRSLFYIDKVSYNSWFIDMSDDWGMVPLPKFTSSQAKYYTYADLSTNVICTLKGSPTVENAGLYLQAANAASYNYIDDLYYDMLTTDVIRDSDTLNMLDYITGSNGLGSVYADFGLMFGRGYNYIANGTYVAMRTAARGGTALDTAVKAGANDIAAQISRDFK